MSWCEPGQSGDQSAGLVAAGIQPDLFSEASDKISPIGVGMGQQDQADTDQKHRPKHPLDRQDRQQPTLVLSTVASGGRLRCLAFLNCFPSDATATSNRDGYSTYGDSYRQHRAIEYRWCLGARML